MGVHLSLKMSDFQKYQNLSPKARKKLKNPATIEGDFLLSCECLERFWFMI